MILELLHTRRPPSPNLSRAGHPRIRVRRRERIRIRICLGICVRTRDHPMLSVGRYWASCDVGHHAMEPCDAVLFADIGHHAGHHAGAARAVRALRRKGLEGARTTRGGSCKWTQHQIRLGRKRQRSRGSCSSKRPRKERGRRWKDAADWAVGDGEEKRLTQSERVKPQPRPARFFYAPAEVCSGTPTPGEQGVLRIAALRGGKDGGHCGRED